MKFATADIVIALSGRAVARSKQYVRQDTIFVYDSMVDAAPEDFPVEAKQILAIPAMEIVKKEMHPRVFNVFIMGAVIGATHVVELSAAEEALEHKLGYKFAKEPELRAMNFAALARGAEEVAKEVGKGA